MKTALVIRHTPVEGIAGFRAPIEAAGYAIDRIDVTDPAFPDQDFITPDLLVMMGGPMAVYERAEHPWIAHEIERIAERIAADRPILGVCLGAQMIAAAMGAEVYPGPVKEIGFAPIALNAAGMASPLRHVAELPVLHWHGDTFDLPEDTELLASTSLYRRQAFRRGPNLLALQCHPEMGEDPRFDLWVDQWPACQAQAGTTAEILRRDHAAHGPAAVKAGRAMIAEWLSGIS